MQRSPNIIERHARNFTLSDKNADRDNWEWQDEAQAKWMPAQNDFQKFCRKWYGITESQSASAEPPLLSLEPLRNLEHTISSLILVRESYVTMFNTVWAKAMSSEGRRGVIITGQPGIGKTVFLYYLLVRLLQRKQVVLFSPNGKMLYLFYHGEVYVAHNEVYTVGGISILPNPKSNSSNVFIWSLFDIREPKEPSEFLVTYPCLPVQTTSPNPIRYKIWDKERMPLLTGLPLWTRDELAQGLRHQRTYHSLLAALHKVYSSSSPNQSDLLDPLDVCLGARALLEEHYSEEDIVQPSPEDAIDYLLDVAIDRFGYSARDVFEAVFAHPEITQRHKRAFEIKYTDFCAAVSSPSRRESASDLVSNRILALSPVDQGPLMSVLWEVDFKSSWVAKSMNRKLGEVEDNEIRRQIRILRNIPEAGGLAGWMLEPLAHRYITNPKDDFLIFNMNSNGNDPPHFTLVRDPPVPDNQQFTKVERKIVRLQSITDLSNCLEDTSYYVPDDPNFPLFDAFTIELDREEKSAILWILQVTTSRKYGGSAKGYQKIREIIMILKDELREDRPRKRNKKAAEQAAPLVQVRYLLIVPRDESQSRNLQWNLPKGWSQNCSRNDHRGNVYCLEVPLTI